jgi:secreted trypsin-like serine protease
MSSRRIALSALLLVPLWSGCEQASPGEPLTTPQYIVNGIIDANSTYSNVGAFIVKRLSDGQIFPICSGTLIAETVFLTAAHCTAAYLVELAPFGFAAYVTFDSPIGYGGLTNNPRVTLNPVSQVVTNPAYTFRENDSGDIGVLILSRSTRGATPATLPTLGLLDKLAAAGKLKNAVFTAVGFGVQERITGGGTPIHWT